ncbi:4'-demethylrebeccamycin synthase 3 [Colletotrichum chlorophyti]|uniref:4'-demethylrebeccamycin synthase 3 n=1 Tax=Colletotrichum chlorophyti TaxID=708187 RepID=A0A1Q8S4B1_9PEZI|nr:4'-demethylrebeccamycin synthase 3 [Colletotrichum chlorophyti]
MTATAVRTSSGAKQKPLILLSAFPGDGHTLPLITIAAHLVKTGYEVAFITTPKFGQKVEDIGAEWIHTENPFTEALMQRMQEAGSLPLGLERLAVEMKHVFFDSLPARTVKTEETLAMLQARDPGRQIIFMEDVFNWSFLPFQLGRPLPRGFSTLPKSIGFGVAALIIESQDTGPITLGLPPDTTDSGRHRNKVLHELVEKTLMKPALESLQESLRETGCTTIPSRNMFRAAYTAHDATIQLCSPSLEYPLSDLPPSVHFSGVLPRKAADSDYKYPSWWPEVERTREDSKYRHVVFVSQGTVTHDYSELVLPTIRAFADRDDVLVVATLGSREAQLPADFTLPPNARVINYVPYDTILEYTDVFVSNGGYGALMHSVRNGVPTILAGESQEKTEVIMRAVYAGLGVSLATQTPSAEQIRKGVEQILKDSKFKKAAVRLRIENENLNALARIEAMVKDLTI